MNVEETIKHLGNHWELYKLAAYEECSFDYAKRYLMDDCGKPESTARAKMGAFRYSRDSLLSIGDDGKCYSIDHDKVDELEMLLDEVIHFTEFDYRYRKLKEYAELCDSQAQDITDWMDMYESLRERLETTKQQLKDENEEIRRKHAKTVAGIADKVEGLATDCDKRLQELEQRDCLRLNFLCSRRAIIQLHCWCASLCRECWMVRNGCTFQALQLIAAKMWMLLQPLMQRFHQRKRSGCQAKKSSIFIAILLWCGSRSLGNWRGGVVAPEKWKTVI